MSCDIFIKAERSLLGLIINGNKTAAEAGKELSVRNFQLPAHQIIHRHIAMLRCEKINISATELIVHLKNVKDDLYSIGGTGVIEKLIEAGNAVDPSKVPDLVKILTQKKAETSKPSLTRSQQIELGGKADQLAASFFRLYADEAKNPPKALIIAGGVEMWPEDRLVIIGGMPGTGKTAIAGAKSVLDLIKQGAHVVVLNYEMRHQASLQRLISCASYGTKTPIETTAIIKRVADVDEIQTIWGVNISQQPGTITLIRPDGPAELEATLTQIRGDHPDGKIVVIYDYLQRMPWNEEIIEPRTRTTRTLRMIQSIANTYGAHSIVIVSVNRSGYGKADMTAYKEAGEIESDADIAVVLTLGRINSCGEVENIECMEDIIKERRQPEVMVLVNVVKQRNESEKQFAVNFIKRYQAFEAGPRVSGAFYSPTDAKEDKKDKGQGDKKDQKQEPAPVQPPLDGVKSNHETPVAL